MTPAPFTPFEMVDANKTVALLVDHQDIRGADAAAAIGAAPDPHLEARSVLLDDACKVMSFFTDALTTFQRFDGKLARARFVGQPRARGLDQLTLGAH